VTCLHSVAQFGAAPNRRSRRGAVGVAFIGLALAGGLLVAPAPAAADPGPGPSAGQVAASKATVAEREAQVKRAAARLARAQAGFEELNTRAEVVFEAYDEAQVKLHSAQHAANTAKAVLALANAAVRNSRRAVAHFARAAYETGGVSTIDAVLSPGGPRSLVQRVGAIDAISLSQHRTLARLDAASIYQASVSQQAQAVAGKARQAAAQAERAKSAAQAAVEHQQQVLASLHRQKAHLAALLADAQAHESKLQRERLAALAAQRSPSPSPTAPSSGSSPYSGTTGDLSGTVSGATGAAAVRQAESQIGKPYEWGAAGPNTYDCSGLVMWAYGNVGVHLDHWTGFQWNEGAHVSTSQLQPGDLLFFAYNTSDPSTIHHVGMYIGNGQMVEAPYTGANVRISSSGRSDYIGAVRPYQR
jgi:cell wall-associated NlpC family hydrolase